MNQAESELGRVALFNVLMGADKYHRELDDVSITAQISFITEEHRELLEALEANDRTEVVDALGDLLVVVGGACHRLGYDADEVLEAVNNSNMSKFVYNEQEAEDSISSYKDDLRYKDVFVEWEGGIGVIKGTVVETGSQKTLKGVHYRGPDWSRIDKNL